MRDSETNEGTDAPCQNCGTLYYTMGDFTTRCDNCGASIADTETGKCYTSGSKTIFSTPGGTPYEN
jgi:ribosomal protein S27E